MASCEVCGDEPTRYVCSNCAKRVGSHCFRTEGWLCVECGKKETITIPLEGETAHRSIGSTLLAIAFLMIFAGVALLVISATSAGQSGLVVIFPFFYASSNSPGFLIVPAIAITAIMIILALLSLRRISEK